MTSPGKGRRIADPVQLRSIPVSAAMPLKSFHGTYDAPTRKPVFDMHYAVETGVVLKGRMRRFFDGVRQDCGPGDIWFCGLLEPHGMQILEAPCEVFVFVAWPPMFREARFPEAPSLNWMAPFLLPPSKRPRATPTERRQALQQVNRFLTTSGLPDAGRPVLLRLSLLEILLPLALRASPDAEHATQETASSNRLAPALNLLENSRQRISLDAAARACAMNRDAFAREFHSLMGLSFIQFNLRHRLNGVAGALASGDAPVKALAHDWGFTDSSHLDRLFTRQYGCHPQQYRDRHGH